MGVQLNANIGNGGGLRIDTRYAHSQRLIFYFCAHRRFDIYRPGPQTPDPRPQTPDRQTDERQSVGQIDRNTTTPTNFCLSYQTLKDSSSNSVLSYMAAFTGILLKCKVFGNPSVSFMVLTSRNKLLSILYDFK